jgi:hypothetical protein
VRLVGFIIKKFVTMHCRSQERKITVLSLQPADLPDVTA